MIWLFATWAMAADCDQAVKLVPGDTAPCEGILVPASQVRELLQLREVEIPRMRAEFEFRVELLTIELDGVRSQLDIERDTVARYRTLLDNPPRPRLLWYEHPAFWTAIGAVAGAGVVVSLAVQ